MTTDKLEDGDVMILLDRPRKARITLDVLQGVESETGVSVHRWEEEKILDTARELIYQAIRVHDSEFDRAKFDSIVLSLPVGKIFVANAILKKILLSAFEEVRALDKAGIGTT